VNKKSELIDPEQVLELSFLYRQYDRPTYQVVTVLSIASVLQ